MFRRLIAGVAVAVLGLSVPLAAPYAAEALPPDKTLTVLDPALDSNCVATISWEPLQGGKPIFANVIFMFDDGDGYSTVPLPGAHEYHKVKQNAGSLVLDFGALAVQQGAPGYRVEVNFVDNKDMPLSGVKFANSICGSV